ncbi:hypothetical protein [Thalassolituus alkanivorans]|uniref:hypothetical protein n=1 Tax=Thalassolituus alkanivorans TaxID=2881055 RepID=UPI001E334BA0|nr:hypothetical protein [Thalassolituus alkanivorans]MCB2387251.1 hypothetical protein [Thalassolituus alkanivorans]MCB2421991.1 hypothetical protein [Thalassolituus alkanivorans]
MKVIDSEKQAWFLLEHEGSLYFDVNCSMGAFGYSYTIRLNDQEQIRYQMAGREYLHKLADDIHCSVPLADNTSSMYQGRHVSKNFSQMATSAIKTWHENGKKRDDKTDNQSEADKSVALSQHESSYP